MKWELKEEAGQITCTQPSMFKRAFELHDGNTLAATLRFPAWPPWKGIAEVNGKQWEFSFISVWRREIGIREEGYDLPFARFTRRAFAWNGLIELPKGERLQFFFSPWRRTSTLVTDLNEPVIQLRVTRGFKKRGTIVMTVEGKELIDKFSWLPAFLWFLALLREHKQ